MGKPEREIELCSHHRCIPNNNETPCYTPSNTPPNTPSNATDLAGINVRYNSDLRACKLNGGWGLYGLIAVQQNDGTFPDPNTADTGAPLNPDTFKTFRIGGLDNTSSDGGSAECLSQGDAILVNARTICKSESKINTYCAAQVTVGEGNGECNINCTQSENPTPDQQRDYNNCVQSARLGCVDQGCRDEENSKCDRIYSQGQQSLQESCKWLDYGSFKLTASYGYDETNNQIVFDPNSNGIPIVAKGKLYFKIMDTYYDDNVGGYEISIISGIVQKKGFIQKAIEVFEKQMDKVRANMFRAITLDGAFISAIRALLVLYVVIQALAFMLGMVKTHQAELVTRLFKVGIISVLISDSAWEFFNGYLFVFFTDGAESIAQMITKSTMLDENGNSKYLLPDEYKSIAVFDIIINMFFSQAFIAKMFALFTGGITTPFAPFIIYGTVIILKAIFVSVKLYLLATIFTSLLIVVAPIMFPFMLFKATNDIFQAWLKQLISNAMLIIVISITIGFMMDILIAQIYNMISFDIQCKGLHLFDLLGMNVGFSWWVPQLNTSWGEFFRDFLSFFIIALLFRAWIDQIPTLIDALSNAQLQPMTRLFGGAGQQMAKLKQSKAAQSFLNNTRVGRRLQLIGTPGVGAAFRLADQALLGGRATKGVDNLIKKGEQKISAVTKPISDIKNRATGDTSIFGGVRDTFATKSGLQKAHLAKKAVEGKISNAPEEIAKGAVTGAGFAASKTLSAAKSVFTGSGEAPSDGEEAASDETATRPTTTDSIHAAPSTSDTTPSTPTEPTQPQGLADAAAQSHAESLVRSAPPTSSSSSSGGESRSAPSSRSDSSGDRAPRGGGGGPFNPLE